MGQTQRTMIYILIFNPDTGKTLKKKPIESRSLCHKIGYNPPECKFARKRNTMPEYDEWKP